ncbi:hypothetical protein CN553_18190 [Bacillus cereus]|uniref:Uncharacterized protein n=1 Tax=Bacillus cereus TaxID=1396 RepID=A0A9X6YL85_BACCE|nr:hypothetical protein [Bacillus cereus]PEN93845.1 hypothetical protein CN553_18190 [Bacillus cereus]
MKSRDKVILKDLHCFRCLPRDDIIYLHFQGLKKAVTCCNTVMKRLRRDGSVDAYKQLLQYEKLKLFKVEPKYSKTYMEPDVFTIWRQSPFFIEVQNSVYSKKVMQEKVNRYEFYFHSLEWQQEPWQPKKSKYFPSLFILTDKQYDIYSPNFCIFQTRLIHDFMNQMVVKV